jgi:protein-tyrosine phosphatase
MLKILIVCKANICRSPMAQAVLLKFADDAGLKRKLKVDSAGTHAGRISEKMDARAKNALSARGYAAGKDRSRKVTDKDFESYELVLAMDQSNLADLQQICPSHLTHKVQSFMAYAQQAANEVPDPYFGNAQGFERVLDLCEAGARGVIAHCQGLLR